MMFFRREGFTLTPEQDTKLKSIFDEQMMTEPEQTLIRDAIEATPEGGTTPPSFQSGIENIFKNYPTVVSDLKSLLYGTLK
jgi:hypothetical protein